MVTIWNKRRKEESIQRLFLAIMEVALELMQKRMSSRITEIPFNLKSFFRKAYALTEMRASSSSYIVIYLHKYVFVFIILFLSSYFISLLFFHVFITFFFFWSLSSFYFMFSTFCSFVFFLFLLMFFSFFS